MPTLSSRDDYHFKHFGVYYLSFFFFFYKGVVVAAAMFVWAHGFENNSEFIYK